VVSQEPKLLPTVAPELAPLIGSFGDATEVVPEGALGAATLERVVARLEDRLPATSARLDEEIRSRVPVAPGPIERAALRAVVDLEMGAAAPWCDGQHRETCLRLAVEKSRALQSAEPQRCAGFQLESRARVATNDPGGVSELLSNADRVEDRVTCLETAAELAVMVRDDARADEALSRIMRAGCASEAECVNNLAWVAGEEEARGNFGRARALYERAYTRDPEQETLLADAARLAARQGLHAEAAADYDKLARAHPSDGHWQEAAQRERESAPGALLPR
jgi:tetratricopeptide (TPR) repeat protein